jgi:hypothetical protein
MILASRARVLGIAFSIISAMAVAEALCQQSILVSPQVTQLEVPPGGRRTFEVVVGNASETTPMVVTIGVSPITQNERGDYKATKVDNKWSCASWITVDKTDISLAPGEWQPIRCEISVPFTAAGGRYAAVTVAFGDMSSASAPVTTRLQYMVGSYVELTVAKRTVTHKAEISNLQVLPARGNKTLEERFGPDAFFITADVTNSGNIGVIATATLRLRQQKGLVRREVPLGTGRGMVLPDATVTYRSLFTTRPPAGVYAAEAALNYGGYKPAVTKLVFSITNEGEIKPGRVEMIETVGLGVIPAKFDLRAGPGSRKTVGITLHNVEDYPVKISTSKQPLSQGPDGRYTASDNPEIRSCHDWIEVEPDSFEVEANTRKRVRVTIEVPKDVEGSAYSRLVFVPVDSPVSKETLEESYSTDLFLNLVPNVRKEIEIETFQATSKGRFQPVTCTFSIKNTGNAFVDIEATARISDTRGPTVREVRLDDRHTRILPGVARIFNIVDDQGLESGTYNAELTIRIDKQRAGFTQHTFSI